MKRTQFFSALLALVLLLTLAACDGGNAPAESSSEPAETTEDPSVTTESPEETTAGATSEEETTDAETVLPSWLPRTHKEDNRGLLFYAEFPQSYVKDEPIEGTLMLRNETDAPLTLYLKIDIDIFEYASAKGDGAEPTLPLEFSDTRETVTSEGTPLPVTLGVGESVTVDFSIPTVDVFAPDIERFYFAVALFETEDALSGDAVYGFYFPIAESYVK